MNKLKRKIKMWLSKKTKHFLDIHIVEHCNLNCKSCAHFSPIAKQSYINLEELEKMYKYLKPIFNKFFKSIHLMGGEPLLHPEINRIIKITRDYFPNTEIQIVTNGVKILEMPKEFFELCTKNNVMFYISQYPININYEKILETMKKYQIKVKISKKIDQFLCYRLDTSGSQNPVESYSKCEYAGYCIQLKNNKLFPCFQSAHIEHINKHFNTKFVYQKGDYLELDKPISKKMFKNFINKPIPFCRYCKTNEQYATKWEISNKSKEEWIAE